MFCNGNTIRSHGLWCSGTVTLSHVMGSVTKVRKAISLDWKFGSKVRKAISLDWKFGSKVRKAIFLDWKFGKIEKNCFAQNDSNHMKHAEIWFLEKLWKLFHFENFGTTVANRAAIRNRPEFRLNPVPAGIPAKYSNTVPATVSSQSAGI